MKKKELLLAASAWFPRPVRHYTFDQNTVNGNVLTDLSGTQNGTIVGNPVFTTGQRGSCVKFDGNKANYIDIGNTDFIPMTGVFSTAFWAKTNYTDSGMLMALVSSSYRYNNVGWSIAFDDRPAAPLNRALRFSIYNGQSPSFEMMIQHVLPIDGLYHHYAITCDSDTAIAYIDGAELSRQSRINPLPTSGVIANTLLGVGNKADSSGALNWSYNGEIDEFRIIPKTLTAQQVKRLYQTGQ